MGKIYNELDGMRQRFIDKFLETYCPDISATFAGFTPKQDATRIAISLLNEDCIKSAMAERKKELSNLAKMQKMDKAGFKRCMMSLYGKAVKANKIKESADILERIAKWDGVNPDKVKVDKLKLEFNLDGNKV